MQSRRGLWGAIILLSAVPLTAAYALAFAEGAEVVIHFCLAAGFALIARSAFDFETRPWITVTGCVSAGALCLIFLLQGLSEALPNAPLRHMVYQVLGQGLETWLGNALLVWCLAVVLSVSLEKTRMLGLLVTGVAVCLQVMTQLGTWTDTEPTGLKLLYLPLFLWLLIESGKKTNGTATPAPARSA